MKTQCATCAAVALLAAAPAAQAFHSAVPPSRRGAGAGRVSVKAANADAPLTSWREKADLLLNPRLSLSERQILTKDLLKDLPSVRDDVREAIQRGGPRAVIEDVVLAPGTEAKRTVEGLRTVQRQVRDDIVPSLRKAMQEGSGVASARARLAAALTDDLPRALQKARQELPERLQKADLSPKGACSAAAALREEAFNTFTRTPANLYTPSYEVVAKGPLREDGTPAYEVRRYEAVALATTRMDSSSSSSEGGDGMAAAGASGDAFNSLLAYLTGQNSAQQEMSMTTPVAIDVTTTTSSTSSSGADVDAEGGSSGSAATAKYSTMSFVLPKGVKASEAPSPTDYKVMIREVPAQLVAVREFTGFATPTEVTKQLADLRSALQSDSQWQLQSIAPGQPDCQLLQYNPPYALPWIRRNEVVVRLQSDDADAGDAAPDSDSSSSVSGASSSSTSSSSSSDTQSAADRAEESVSDLYAPPPGGAAAFDGKLDPSATAAAANPAADYLEGL